MRNFPHSGSLRSRFLANGAERAASAGPIRHPGPLRPTAAIRTGILPDRRQPPSDPDGRPTPAEPVPHPYGPSCNEHPVPPRRPGRTQQPPHASTEASHRHRSCAAPRPPPAIERRTSPNVARTATRPAAERAAPNRTAHPRKCKRKQKTRKRALRPMSEGPSMRLVRSGFRRT